MKLVIVESPTKAKTISKFLGKEYKVESSYGHVRDLPRGKLGVDVDDNFEPGYVIPRKVQKQVTALKKTAAGADEVILASDEDREGEAIAWHLVQALKLDDRAKRIVFHEITKGAIEEAIKSPRTINQDLVDAQQARRVIDRLVGYKLSPFLWKKIRSGLSAGRVQSVALKIIVEREEEIKAFKPEEYWTIKAMLEAGKDVIEADLVRVDGKKLDKLDIKIARDAQTIVNDIKKGKAAITSVVKKDTVRRPLPPFITSTLQRAASSRLGYSAKKTMMFAQRLYENGHITYMRTDSVSLSKQSTAAAKDYLAKNFGEVYAKDAPKGYRGKSKLSQEAHEAVRPTDPFVTPDTIKATPEARRLYELIWQRFMASQMPDAAFEATAIEVEVKGLKGKYLLKTNGNIMKFDGFLKVWPSKIEERSLPSVQKGQDLGVKDAITDQHFTEPPPRYNEASLIKVLEEYGIGRPSTYAPIISVIQDRGYVVKDQGRRFIPEEIGELVSSMLTEHFPNIVDVQFTAKIEEEFDQIANGVEDWKKMVRDFYEPFATNLDDKYETVETKKVVKETDIPCDKCGKMMQIKHGRYGEFMACPGYPECKNTKNIKKEPDTIGMQCPECHEGEIVVRKTRKGRIFYGCERYPDCEYASWDNPKEKKEKEGKEEPKKE